MSRQCNPRNRNANNPEYICNPQSGRWVKRSGTIGRRIYRLLSQQNLSTNRRINSRRTRRRITRRRSPIRRRSPRRTRRRVSRRRSPMRRRSPRRTRRRVSRRRSPVRSRIINRRNTSRRIPTRRSTQSDYVNLSSCQDDIDYLVTQDELSEFEPNEIVSINIDGINHCFPRSSIVDSMERGPYIFASPEIRSNIMQFLSRFIFGHGESFRDKVDEVVLRHKKIDYINTKKEAKAISLIVQAYRLYKWPLGGTILIPNESILDLKKPSKYKYKMKFIDGITDGSSFAAYGVGAVHGPQRVYQISSGRMKGMYITSFYENNRRYQSYVASNSSIFTKLSQRVFKLSTRVFTEARDYNLI